MTENFIQGTPPAVFLPAKNYVFKHNEEHHIIKIPRSGKYCDLAPDIFTEDDGEFNILADNNILYMPAITKVLFAISQYPDLEFNQFFCPYSIQFEEDEVVIVGQVIDMMLNADEYSKGDNEESSE